MRRSRITAAVAALLLALAVVSGGLASPAPSVSATAVPLISFHPILTIKPIVTLWPIDYWMTVSIPDPKLNAALHTECGVAQATALVRGDLYGLSGSLDLRNLGIQDLTGIQFCRNVQYLSLNGNPIATVPDLAKMTGLQQLYLEECDLKEVPANLATLPNLKVLSLEYNKIRTLPTFLTTMGLTDLLVGVNELTEVPTGFGAGGLKSLYLDFNKLTSIPDDLLDSAAFRTLYLTGNRFTSLPAKMKTHAWTILMLEFNFLDVSVGSPDYEICTGLTASLDCMYERQCVPLLNLAATPASDSVTLTWDKNVDASGSEWILKVNHYLVYLVEGSNLTELAVLGKDATQYVDEGLAPLTDRRYYVGVEYAATFPGGTFYIRGYKTLDAQTLAAPTATPEPTLTIEPTSGPTSSPTPTPGSGTSGLPAWLILTGIGVLVLGIAVVVGVVVLVVKLAKPKPPAPPTPPQS